MLVMIGVTLYQHSRHLGSSHNNSFARKIERHVIVHARTWKGSHDFSAIGVEYEKLRRLACGDEQPMVGLVQNHRVGDFGIWNRPTRNLFARGQVNDSNLFRAAEIYIHFFAVASDGHGFRMISGQRNIPNQLEGFGINDVNQVRASFGVFATTLHIVVLVYGIENGAIDTRWKLDLVDDAVVLAAHEFNRPEIVVPIGHNKIIGLGQKKNGVRASKSCDALEACTTHKIENLDGLVILGREE